MARSVASGRCRRPALAPRVLGVHGGWWTLCPRKGDPMTFNVDIVAAAKANRDFRTVVSTGPNAQVVLMSIPPGGEIGMEVHAHVDQVLVFVAGTGVASLDGEESVVGSSAGPRAGRRAPQRGEPGRRGSASVHDLRAAAARAGDRPPDQGGRRCGRGGPRGSTCLSLTGPLPRGSHAARGAGPLRHVGVPAPVARCGCRPALPAGCGMGTMTVRILD